MENPFKKAVKEVSEETKVNTENEKAEKQDVSSDIKSLDELPRIH